MLNVSSSWNPFGIFFLIDQNVQIFFIGSMSIVGGRGCSCGVTLLQRTMYGYEPFYSHEGQNAWTLPLSHFSTLCQSMTATSAGLQTSTFLFNIVFPPARCLDDDDCNRP